MRKLAILLIRTYQYALAPLIPKSCRYTPSCSEYGIEAFRKYPFFKALKLTASRIARCHPWGGHGHDPVP
ncbi:MAG: membrane protein insertion efficiency factor YidD [Bacteroidetes bacterium]|nr:membrane protein insertion efficiency factor YidD [Bacteroidota bacterium]